MVAYQRKNESKSLLVSLFAHAVLIGGYFLFLHQQSLTLMQSSKMVVMEIATFERPPAPTPPVVEPTPPTPIQEVKPEPIKPIDHKHKEKKKHKPRVEEPINPVPIKEEVAPAQPVLSQPSTPVVTPSPSIPSEPYIRTDFEIIRDKVISNLVYPNIAKRMNWNGVVHVALEIDTNGFLLKASIHQSSGRDILDNAALEAANRLKNQQLPKPQSTSTVILPIAFKLR